MGNTNMLTTIGEMTTSFAVSPQLPRCCMTYVLSLSPINLLKIDRSMNHH